MGLSEVERKIQEIEERSERRYGDLFKSASNGKRVLKEDADRYERLLHDLEKIRNFEAFVAANQSIIDQYNLLHSELKNSGIVLPEKKEETAALVGPVATPEKKTESTELVGPVVAPDKKSESTELVGPVVAPEQTNEYSYRLKRGEIIQDLPIDSKEEQKFATPGMSRNEIAYSRGRLAGIGIADTSKMVDPIEAEIERRKAEYDAKKNGTDPVVPPIAAPAAAAGVEPEKKEASEPFTPIPVEELGEAAKDVATDSEDKKKKTSKRKVKNRKKYDWNQFKTGFKDKVYNPIKSSINKTTVVLKGLLFSENLTNKSASYQAIYPLILSLRATYKHRTSDVNLKEVAAIDRMIASKSDLTLAEKKRLITKLAALHKSIEKQSKKEQSKAVTNSTETIEELDSELGLRR